jgi:hypothetical protein
LPTSATYALQAWLQRKIQVDHLIVGLDLTMVLNLVD